MLIKTRPQPQPNQRFQPYQSHKPQSQVPSKPKEPAPPPMVRTPEGLCEVLCDEIDKMRAGKTTARNANAVAKLASQIIGTVSLELEIQKVRHRMPEAEQAVNEFPMSFGHEEYQQIEQQDQDEKDEEE